MDHRPAFLFLHGFPLSGAMWRHQAAAFAPRFRVMTPDLVGFGATPPEASFSLAQQAGSVLDVALDAGVEEFVLCGLSMGGYIAFEMLRQAPSRVRALVLTNTRATADAPETAAARLTQAAAVRERGAEAVIEALLPKLCAAEAYETSPQLIAELRGMMAATPVEGILAGLDALRTRRDHTDLLASIPCPTLVVTGAGDVLSPPEVMREMAAQIPGARTALIEHAGHLAPLEQPGDWNDAVATFLGDVLD